MRQLFSIFIFISIFLHFTFNTYAQENLSPTPSEVKDEMNTYGASLSDFIGTLLTSIKKNKVDRITDINTQSLPPDFMITPIRQPTNVPLKAKSTNLDLNADTSNTNVNPIYDTVGGYVMNNAMRKSSNSEPVSSDIGGVISGFVKNILDLFGIVKIGDSNALEMYKINNPADVAAEKYITVKSADMLPESSEDKKGVGLDVNAAGSSTNLTSPVSDVLPALWCEGLPPGTCVENKPIWAN